MPEHEIFWTVKNPKLSQSSSILGDSYYFMYVYVYMQVLKIQLNWFSISKRTHTHNEIEMHKEPVIKLFSALVPIRHTVVVSHSMYKSWRTYEIVVMWGRVSLFFPSSFFNVLSCPYKLHQRNLRYFLFNSIIFNLNQRNNQTHQILLDGSHL